MTRQVLAAALALLAYASGCGIGKSDRPSGPQAQPGDVALDYISGDVYPSLLVEIDYMEGSRPSDEAVGKMREVFARRLEKPGGVEAVIDSQIPAAQQKDRYQVGDVLALESQYRHNHTGDAANPHQAVIWVVYLNGASEFDEGTTRALGISYDASSVAVFRQNITRTTPQEGQVVVEAMVLVHEGGHLFGLVNNGLPMVNLHEDAAHPRHDVNAGCVMSYRIETSDVQRVLNNPPIDYDYQCRLDMFAAGGADPGPREEAPAILAQPPGTEPPPASERRGPIPDTGTERP